MITTNISRLKLELYNGIDELPSERFHKFNLFSLIDAGIGGDVESVQNHITHIYQALQRKDFGRLKTLFENYHHNLHFLIEDIDPRSMAFACLVKSIDGTKVEDITDENLRAVSKRITRRINRRQYLKLFEEIKKKLKPKSKSISRIELVKEKQRYIMDSLKDVQSSY